MSARLGFFRTLFGAKTKKCDVGEEERSGFEPENPSPNTFPPTLNVNKLSSGGQMVPVLLSEAVIMEGYLTKGGGNSQKFLNRTELWKRRYFTLTNTGNIYMYRNRQERNNPKYPTYTQKPLRLSDYYVEVNNLDDELRAENNFGAERSKSVAGSPKSILSVRSISVPDDSEIKPFRFQMTLVLRKHVDLLLQVDNKGVISRTAPNNKQSRYRDHWVLRCDTEEELQHWVHTMQQLCPSSFEAT